VRAGIVNTAPSNPQPPRARTAHPAQYPLHPPSRRRSQSGPGHACSPTSICCPSAR
jgi:hypothetical protein